MVWGKNQLRDFVWIDDFCEGIMAAIERFPRGGAYTLGTGIGTSFVQLAEMIADAVGYTPFIGCDETKATSTLVRVAKQCGQPEYGWMPKVALAEGIARSIEYFKAQGRL
jgi:nucleoside-diphosphate-sugar epimerase